MKPPIEKRTYEKPAMQVYELSQQPQLLSASGLDDYNRPSQPYEW